MTMRIGDNMNLLFTRPPAASGLPGGTGAAHVFPPPREPERTSADLFERGQQPRLRTGFGRDTVSIGAASVRAIDGTFDGARKTVPTVQETIDRQRVRAAAVREERFRRLRTNQRPVTRTIPAPDAQARNFITALNDTASTAQARVRGEEPAASARAARIEVNGQAFPVDTEQGLPRAGEPLTPRLDIRA